MVKWSKKTKWSNRQNGLIVLDQMILLEINSSDQGKGQGKGKYKYVEAREQARA